jgi:hypothetical protein
VLSEAVGRLSECKMVSQLGGDIWKPHIYPFADA